MIIRLNERLRVDEKQKTEITSMLFTFMKKIDEEYKERDRKPTNLEIVNMWLKYTKKPEWIQKKIEEDIEFLAGICEFVNMYRKDVVSTEIEEYDLAYKM